MDAGISAIFPFWIENSFLGKSGRKKKKSKLSVYAEIWYLEWFEYVEFIGDVHFNRFRLQIPFLDKFGPKNQTCQFKLKFGI